MWIDSHRSRLVAVGLGTGVLGLGLLGLYSLLPELQHQVEGSPWVLPDVGRVVLWMLN